MGRMAELFAETEAERREALENMADYEYDHWADALHRQDEPEPADLEETTNEPIPH